MAKVKKNGPITQGEIDFIRLNMKNMSATDIAEALGRNPDTVLKYMNQMDTLGLKSQILDLTKREDWQTIQQQFTPEEIEVFKAHWNGVVQQFKEEIYYTESLQILAAIKHDIISNRVLIDQMKIKNEVARLEDELDDERDKVPKDLDRINSIEAQIAAYCAAEQINGKEFREGSSKLMSVLKDLKALRADRVSKVEDMKRSFASFMRNIIEDPAIKRELGGYMEKMRLAQEQEYIKLGTLHKYANGEYDRPLLNSQTVHFGKEEENNEEDSSMEVG